MSDYKPLQIKSGRWIKEGTEQDGKSMVGKMARLTYPSGDYRIVEIVGFRIVGPLVMPIVKTIRKSENLKLEFKEKEAIYPGRSAYEGGK